MVEPYQSRYLEPGKRYRRFSLLMSIQKDARITQKQLGGKTCLSSSMVNNYIKELSKEGLIQIKGNSNRDMAYHLTPAGKAYVSENFLHFSAEIVQFYAGVRREISDMLTEFYNDGIRTVVLYGASDTAEIVYSALEKTELALTGVVDNDPGKVGTLFWGFEIRSPAKINDIRPDALLITSFARQNEILETLRGKVNNNIQIKVISRY